MTLADLPAGEPPGFPNCAGCPYLRTGPARICVSCAGRTLDAVAPGACPACSQARKDGAPCRNPLCADPRRRIERIDAIAYLSGPLRSKIFQYKYHGAAWWSLVFGRLLTGWLEARAGDGDWADLIVANPTYLAPRVPGPGHIEKIIRSTVKEAPRGRWPFDINEPAAVIKTQETLKSSGQDTSVKRLAGADLRGALKIPDPGRTRGRKILIFDDVCTTGSQLDAVAACLLDEGGAAGVRAVVLARAAWRP